MNGLDQRPQLNGQHTPNGITSTHHHQATEAKIARPVSAASPVKPPCKACFGKPYTNGLHPASAISSRLDEAPPEILDLVSSEHYLPIATIINRRAQATWRGLTHLIDVLASFDVPMHVASAPGAPIKNQSRENVEKKDRILQFFKHERNDFIKLLVLLDWGKKADQVAKTISISNWLDRRREAYWGVVGSLAALKRDALLFQIPSPDLATAGEVLSTGRVSALPDLGYRKAPPLSPKQIEAVLNRLNRALTLRLVLDPNIPPSFRHYAVHDGRVTFTVPGEFEVDLSVLEDSAPSAPSADPADSAESPFQFVDFRFDFEPRPAVPDLLQDEIERICNHQLAEKGLLGCYEFLHELTLSNKLVQFQAQAFQLARNQWSGHLKVEFLRRNLIVQYWPSRQSGKSWLEIGINKGSADNPSRIAVRSFRDGKQALDFRPELDLSDISLELLLYQAISQHCNRILDSIYDRLVDIPVFKEGELCIEQSSSQFVPEDCFLQIQVTPAHEIAVAIDPITGSVNISPASESASRFQLELSRSKDLSNEFAPRLLGFRCALNEARVLAGTASSPWVHLESFKPALAEMRKLLASPITRINFFRHPTWSSNFLFAVSHGADGDEIWILQLQSDGPLLSLAGLHVVHREALAVSTDLSPEFFELLTLRTSQLIAAHVNAEALRTRGWHSCQSLRRSLQASSHTLLLLSFDIPPKSSPHSSADHVLLHFADLRSQDRKCILTAIVRTMADSAVLVQLSASNPNPHISFSPKARQITFEIESTVGRSSIGDIANQVSRLHDLTACVQTVRSLSTISLARVSMTGMTVNYEIGPVKDQSLIVSFPSPNTPARLDFEPVLSNLHTRLAPAMSKMLNNPEKAFAANLTDVISALTLTAPLMMALRDLEQSFATVGTPIRVHILVRQPTMFAIQFFTVPNPNSSSPRPQSRPLARLEILPQSTGKDLWLLRPPVDKFNQYTNPFASEGLQNKLRQEIFARPSPDWIRLDNAALCLASRPQPLLKALTEVMIAWVNEKGVEEVETVTMAQSQPPEVPTLKLPPKVAAAAAAAAAAANQNYKNTGRAVSRPTPGQTQHQQPFNQAARPNGINQAAINHQAAVQKPRSAGFGQPPKGTEVYILD